MSGAAGTISKLIATIATKPVISTFTDVVIPDMDINNPKNISGKQILVFFLVFTLLLGIMFAIGTYFFNQTIPHIFPSIRKITFPDFVGLYIVIHILRFI